MFTEPEIGTDRRKPQVLEARVASVVLSEAEGRAYNMAGLELLSDQGYRIDGRRAGELRKIQARMGVFAQADGSAYIEQGNTKALAVVYGPHEASKRPGAGLGAARRGSRPKPYGLTPPRNGSSSSPRCLTGLEKLHSLPLLSAQLLF